MLTGAERSFTSGIKQGQRSCVSTMNAVRKRLRLCPSKPPPTDTGTSTSTSTSHDVLLPWPPAARGGGEEEEEEDTTDSRLIITMEDSQTDGKITRKAARRRKRKLTGEVERGRTSESEEEEEEEEDDDDDDEEEEEEEEGGVEIDRQLDQSLETKSRQHNLTTVNVRNILHEVITNEHVVAMMKAAMNETEAVPPFEPKMTRAKFKEVVEKGVVIPAWNISPIKKSSDLPKAPQFVDIPLADEDSSDEEYHPDEEEEDETAEDTFQESDMESTASSPRGSRLNRQDEDSCSPWQSSRSRSRRLRVGSISMGPPPPPRAPPPRAVTDSTFLEKLHAVEEELAVCLEPYQPLSESEDEAGLMAYRTRSKRPLRDVPLGRLEAELRAPDITPDMYDSSSTHEDRDWTDWLRGLMTSDVDNEDECDDEDDPEYNFLADNDEPDLEDYRDDKAVRITKKEVNELMEELFQTLKEDLAGQEVDDEGHEEEEEPQEEAHTVETHTPEEKNTAMHEDQPITEQHRTVKQQLALIRKRRQTLSDTYGPEPNTLTLNTLALNTLQKKQLQQQLQQHVQLLTQVHLLTAPVSRLQSEAETSRQFLVELDMLAQRAELIRPHPGFCSAFRASNLQEALQLLEELRQTPISYRPPLHPPDARGYVRCFPVMPAELAWLFATRSVFLYPELLPCASLDPALYCPRRTAAFTAAEDCLLVLGLRNMEGTCDPPKLVSQFLLRKTLVQVRRRLLQCCRPGFPDNIVKAFRYQRVLWSMPVSCRRVDPAERRPPVEREESVMPLWLLRSLPVIYAAINSLTGSAPEHLPPSRVGGAQTSQLTFLRSASYSFPPGAGYPPRLPENLDFRRIGFVLRRRPLPSSPPPPPPSVLPLTGANPPADTSTVSTVTREQIRRHSQTLAGLRRSDKSPASSQVTGGHDVIEEEEEEGSFLLTLSESPSSTAGSVAHDNDLAEIEEAESEREQEVMVCRESAEEDDNAEDGGTSSEESRASVLQENLSSDEDEDVIFAQDYLRRVCETVQACPGLLEQLLQVLDEFSAAGPPGAAEVLYDRLSHVLRPWPQLLRDFAAFLNRGQAQRCGLLLEQQLFERSRRFLRQLGRNLLEGSSLYQQVVSVPLLEDMKLQALLRQHPPLQDHLHLFLQQRLATGSKTSNMHSVSQNPHDRKKNSSQPQTGSDREEEEEEEEEERRRVCAKNISITSSGEKVVVWTREADRSILTACQQKGANWKTFRQVSAQLGNKTVHQVRLRFQDLMKLFHSVSTSCSSESRPISREKAPPH